MPQKKTTANKPRPKKSAVLKSVPSKSQAAKPALKLVTKATALSAAARQMVRPAAKKSKTTVQTSSPSKKVAFTSKVELKRAPLPEAATKEIPKTDPKLEQNLAKKPAGSLQSPLRLFQIYYEPWQRELLDPNFAALDNSKSDSELLEFAVFEKLAKSEYVKGAQLWGALSWRFTEKTGMTGADWVKTIQANPGCDIYYCDPFPHNEALFHNLWMQGDTTHPQLMALCQAVFQVADLPVEELTNIYPSNQFSAANYFVGSPKFWAAYLPWVANILSLANKKLPPKVRDLLHSKQADERDLHNGATYVPFIVERLFPVFMKTAGKGLKPFKIALPERERELNVHLKLLREMKDVAHKTNSAWLAACWVNYRNLYMTQANSKEWCEKHLRKINPPDIKFF
ncbi:hypothetical protein G6644_08695 [Polynucleobacter paneuropaeus]|nr:hypothetical protein [Polynucleobacter paneuropaeus]MBT8638574.1 hypothetical protein [Polynucleobacter paneuropaeus]